MKDFRVPSKITCVPLICHPRNSMYLNIFSLLLYYMLSKHIILWVKKLTFLVVYNFKVLLNLFNTYTQLKQKIT